jgi:hypothetical protein
MQRTAIYNYSQSRLSFHAKCWMKKNLIQRVANNHYNFWNQFTLTYKLWLHHKTMNGILMNNHWIDPIIYGYPWTIIVTLMWNYVYQWKVCSISLQEHVQKGHKYRINVQFLVDTNTRLMMQPLLGYKVKWQPWHEDWWWLP